MLISNGPVQIVLLLLVVLYCVHSVQIIAFFNKLLNWNIHLSVFTEYYSVWFKVSLCLLQQKRIPSAIDCTP